MARVTNLILGVSWTQSAQIWALKGYEDKEDFVDDEKWKH